MRKLRKSKLEMIMSCIIYGVMIAVLCITVYPIFYTMSMSISDDLHVIKNSVWLLPKGFTLNGYELVFENPDVWRSYYNTIWYTVIGTLINVLLTVISAYPLAQKQFFARKALMFFAAFTMFFSGGIIPLFILINKLGMYNTRWAMILPGAISAWNLIIARTFMMSIPYSLQESAKIDGANEIKILFRIIIPLCMPIIAVLTIFYAVFHWNSFFNALLFIPDTKLQPLQIYLRKVLVLGQSDALLDTVPGISRTAIGVKIRYCVIVVSILPILCVYPFFQKHFVKGVMIGAIKG
jgi:putative aldouronate transport system permease protein